MAIAGTATIRVADRFDGVTADEWEAVLAAGPTRTVFVTRPWQQAWWETFGRGRLLLIVARPHGGAVLAPLFADEDGMVYFVGSGGSDYLDFLGVRRDPRLLAEMLGVARELTPGFSGFRFYHVPDRSPTGASLAAAAPLLDLECLDEGSSSAPALELAAADDAVRKKSLVRHENFFRREGALEVVHARDGREILPQLGDFFAQHVARWEETRYPSLFLQPRQRAFYRRLAAADTEWLRFTRIDWNGDPIAFHFGFCYEGSFLWYKPSFEIRLARRSPGEVLLRRLLLAARDEGAHTFDFGLGDEPFKRRFATRLTTVRTWDLSPKGGRA